MGLKLITAPPVEPLTRADAYVQCQIDTTTAGSPPVTTSPHDDWLNSVIPVVRQQAEGETRRAFVLQTWELSLNQFPGQVRTMDGFLGSYAFSAGRWRDGSLPIRIPLPPLRSITSIKYIDTDGVEQTMDAADYQVDDTVEPALVYPAAGTCWPTVKCDTINAVKVRFVCGYAPTYTGSPPTVSSYTANIPQNLMHWMVLQLTHWFRNREASWQVTSTAVVADVPYVKDLLDAHRVYGGFDDR